MQHIEIAGQHRHPLYGTPVPVHTVAAVRAWQRRVARRGTIA